MVRLKKLNLREFNRLENSFYFLSLLVWKEKWQELGILSIKISWKP